MTSPRRAFVAIVAVTLAGQFCAMAYEVVVAARFGTSFDADDLALSLTLISAIANEIVTWISTLFIPYYLEAHTAGGPGVAGRFFRASLMLLLVGTGAVTVLLVIGAPEFVALLAPALAARAGGATLLRLFAPLLVLLPLSVLLAGTLQAHRRFTMASLRQVCWYGLALMSILAIGPRLGPAAVPIGMVAGLALFCTVLTVHIRAVIDAGKGGEPAGPRIRRLALSLPPLAIASAANYVNVAFERGIAARLPEGTLAGLTYAFRLLNFPINLFLLNATTMLFPALVAHASRDEGSAVEALLGRSLRLAMVFTVPLVALSIALSEPAIRVLLERGAFTTESTHITATALVYYAPGLIGMAGVQVLVRAYQALHEVGRLVRTGIAVVALNIVLMPTLTALIGFRGLPLAISLSAITLFVVMLLGIRRRLPGLDLTALSASALRIVGVGAVALGCAWMVYGKGAGDALSVLVTGSALAIAVYALLLFWFSRDDARLALTFLAPGLARRVTPDP